MRLEPLCTIDLGAPEDEASARAPGATEGTGLVMGDGAVSGERLSGALRYSRRVLTRGDGYGEVELQGLVTTAAGAPITLRASGNADATGWSILTVSFQAQDGDHRWLNGAICLAEGANRLAVSVASQSA